MLLELFFKVLRGFINKMSEKIQLDVFLDARILNQLAYD